MIVQIDRRMDGKSKRRTNGWTYKDRQSYSSYNIDADNNIAKLCELGIVYYTSRMFLLQNVIYIKALTICFVVKTIFLYFKCSGHLGHLNFERMIHII